ncbi:precorrin-3B synthase [Spongiactinospora sp. 9N601]|uniref:precorrin-3B synthase n=1 Tax=Spongiactinospora sp. 9N601 TaxID=3375149 RepID=UPI0037874157
MSKADFSGRMRPDACPGALQVHEAADGPLARVRLPGGAITSAQLSELADGAAELGAGVIELTSRANVQVRGLRSPAAFAEKIAAAGLLPSAAHERVRNIVASPLGGRRTGLDTQPVVAALDRELCAVPELASLPGRFLFAVDDGTGDVLNLGADIAWNGRLLLAGMDAGLTATMEEAPGLMIAAARAFLAERTDSWRIAELPDGPARIARHLGGTAGDSPAAPEGRELRAGRIIQRDGRVALSAVVPLGRLTAAQARVITGTVRLTPWRTIVLLDLDPAEAGQVEQELNRAGLVTDPASPWNGVSACTGRPGCAKALADVREDARRWVGTLAAPAPAPVHWSGCERRCGLPRGRVVQMTATPAGYHERTP